MIFEKQFFPLYAINSKILNRKTTKNFCKKKTQKFSTRNQSMLMREGGGSEKNEEQKL